MQRKYRIVDICQKILSGGTPNSRIESYYNGTIPWLNTKEIDFNRIYSTEKTITDEGLVNSSAKWVPKHSVIVAMYGATAAKVAYTEIDLTTNQACCNLVVDPAKADSRYVYYYLKNIYSELGNLAIGAAQQNLSVKVIGEFPISLPSMEEQKRIAGILSALDDKIELNRRINANLELQAQTLFNHWFVENPDKTGCIYALGDVADISAGGDKPTICAKQPTPVCNVPIYSNGIDNEGLYGYTDTAKINQNCITVSARGTIGYVVLRQHPYYPIVRLISVLPKKEIISAEYLYLWAKTQNISGTGTTQQQLTVPDFRKTQIYVPYEDKMREFTSIVKPMFVQIDHNKQSDRITAELRDSILSKLMNEEIR